MLSLEKMISLSGFVPNKDIQIKVTSLRPGEKLYEELLNEQEQLQQTYNDKIMIGKFEEHNFEEVNNAVCQIIDSVDNLSKTVIRNLKKLSFVKDVLEDGNNLRIKLATREDVRSEVSQAISSGGGIILSMNLKGGSLEDIFLNLLAEDKGGKQ